jgi:hypothetical protein
MAYNRRNLLCRICDVQEITLREKERGVSQVWIYNNIFALPPYKISYSTYNRYLSVAAKRDLKKLTNAN